MKSEKQSNNDGLDAGQENADSKQFLTFKVEKEEYGVSLMTIREIKGWSKPTVLPNSPPFMKGVINLRGVVIPIFDLRHRFEMGTTEPNEKNVVIIIAVNQRLIGVLVDAVSDILTVSVEQIKSAPKMDTNIDENYVDGLIQSDDKMVVILNIENLFDSNMLCEAEKIASKADVPQEQTTSDN
ncbi:MAG: chemotaxis protein CheW [Rickettsiales bacterium]|nr:chemotaxis protein CheW [Pseudomonadota bacterium]MDA0967057.1 chemotaxis protein CheW [Pseudomonadota bacterium]MDG4542457.1 chemotaxis protein CheW [Rickettsiales bacterium]MDG4544961.1 chemotaxis protein CheW [Rickettsiales bacterium]MDG4547084.1 chemotaxis protein CheW [Rickettsiales bacterium]